MVRRRSETAGISSKNTNGFSHALFFSFLVFFFFFFFFVYYFFSFIFDIKSFFHESSAAADIAWNIDCRQEMHLYGNLAIAFAGFTATAGTVEREAAGSPASSASFRASGEHVADMCPSTDISGRIRARSAADR